MITEPFLDSCFYVLLNKSANIIRNKNLYRDIGKILKFYNDKDTLQISALTRPKFECLEKICELGIENRETSNIIDSILSGKFSSLAPFIKLSVTDDMKSTQISDHVKQIRIRKKIISLFSNYDIISKFVEVVGGGTSSDLENLTIDYETIIKTLYTNLMEENRSVNIESVSSLDFMSDDFGSVTDQIKRRSEIINAIPTGYSYLDNEIFKGGFEPTRLYTFGGAPGTGKSTLLTNLITNSAKRLKPRDQKNILLYVTMENLIDESFERAYCCYFDVKAKDFSESIKSREDVIGLQHKFRSELEKNNTNIFMKYYAPRTVSSIDLMMTIDDVNSKYGKGAVRAIYIDYLDLLKSDVGYDNDFKTYDFITLGLKLMAVEYNIPVIVVTQLNRTAYSVSDARELGMDMFSRSVGKVEHSDVIGMVAKDRHDENLIHFKIGKNRSGKAGQTLSFESDLSKFKIYENTSMMIIPSKASFSEHGGISEKVDKDLGKYMV